MRPNGLLLLVWIGFCAAPAGRAADVTDDTPYVVLTTWRDRAAFEAWVGSDDFRLAHSNPMPKEAFDGEGKLEMHEVIVAGEHAP